MSARSDLFRSPRSVGFLTSLALHLLLWGAFAWKNSIDIADGAVDPLEIDLTRPFRITDDPRLARRAEKPGAGAPLVQTPTPIAGKGAIGGQEDAPSADKGPAKDWVLPTEKTVELEKPVLGEAAGRPDGVGEGAGLGGLGDGTGDGEVDWIYLTEVPRLLNRGALMRDIRRFYPERERLAGREARVGLDLHVGPEGRVVRVSVVDSGGELFDQAARQVVSRARFSPARAGSKKVSIKIRFPIEFRLE